MILKHDSLKKMSQEVSNINAYSAALRQIHITLEQLKISTRASFKPYKIEQAFKTPSDLEIKTSDAVRYWPLVWMED